MKSQKIIQYAGKSFIVLCLLSLGYVAIMAMISPQATMDLVQVELGNNDARSSIRGIYGGVGLLITGGLVYLLLKNVELALALLSMFWSAYAFSRVVTLIVDGALGDFGQQWLIIETVFALIALGLWYAIRQKKLYIQG